MFAFFKNGTFFDFWGNTPGDGFVDLTILKMGWNSEEITLRRYDIPVRRPEFFKFEENGDLTIQELQTIPGDPPTEELVDIQTIASELYVLNGVKERPC